MSCRLLTTVAVSLLLTSPNASAFDCTRTESVLGRGPGTGVAVAGGIAVVGAGATLVGFDLAEPSAPLAVGEIRFDSGTAPGHVATPLVGAGDLVLAWVVDARGGRLSVVDPNARGGPAEIGSLPMDTYARDAVVVDGRAWVATASASSPGGLASVELDDPLRPAAGARVVLARDAEGVAASGELLVVATRAGLHLVDVSRAAEPVVVGWLPLSGAVAVAAVGGHAYVLTDALTLHAIDLADPAAPALVASAAVSGGQAPGGILADGDRLYVGLLSASPWTTWPTDGGLAVFDIADRSQPVQLGAVAFPSGALRLAMSGPSLLVADVDHGMRILTTSSQDVPVEIARRNITFDNAFAIAVAGDLAFVGDQGLRLVDVSDHQRPRELGAIALDGDVLAVAARDDGSLALVVLSTGEVAVVDTSTPAAPSLRALTDPTGTPRDVVLEGDLATLAAGGDGLLVVDVSDPTRPVEVGGIATSGTAEALALRGAHAVVGLHQPAGGGALAVIDLTRPDVPILVGQIALPRPVAVVAVSSATALAFTSERVHVVDLSDPAAPTEVASGAVASASGAAFHDGLAYVSRWPGSLQLLDLTVPEQPIVGARTTWEPFATADGPPQGGFDVAVHAGSAVVADGGNGLRLVSFARCLAGPVRPSGAVSVD